MVCCNNCVKGGVECRTHSGRSAFVFRSRQTLGHAFAVSENLGEQPPDCTLAGRHKPSIRYNRLRCGQQMSRRHLPHSFV